MRRRRYEVVMEGLHGQATAQRTVVSEHRSEQDARDGAAHALARLETIYGTRADAWRVRVMRDDETVVELRPVSRGPAPPPAARPAPADEDDGGGGPVPPWLIERMEHAIARRRARTYGDDEDGSGDD